MKRLCESSADRITDLPAEVTQRILVFLPIKDAARTSVLSRKWRHQWRSIPELVFDDGFAQIPEVPGSEWRLVNKQVLLDVYKCLLLCERPITKFVLSIPGLLPCHEIDLIILYLSNEGLQHFTLVFSNDDGYLDNYQVHSSLFSALHLKSLKLESCDFTPPSWFVGFSKLTHLQLENISLPDDFFNDFLPKCPMLECLAVLHCTGPPDGKLELVAPFLKSLTFQGVCLDVCFNVKSAPLLSYVVLDCNDDGYVPDMVALFASLPALQQFVVNCEILKYLAIGDNVPTRLPTTLHRLNVLDFKRLIFDDPGMERVFFCLLMSSPNLHSLTVQLQNSQRNVEPPNNEVSSLFRLLEAENCPGSSDCLRHLVEFRIVESLGTQVELDLVRFVLATAPLLRLIHVTPAYKLETKKILKFMKEVMQYTRISKEAKVTYDWNEEEG